MNINVNVGGTYTCKERICKYMCSQSFKYRSDTMRSIFCSFANAANCMQCSPHLRFLGTCETFDSGFFRRGFLITSWTLLVNDLNSRRHSSNRSVRWHSASRYEIKIDFLPPSKSSQREASFKLHAESCQAEPNRIDLSLRLLSE